MNACPEEGPMSHFHNFTRASKNYNIASGSDQKSIFNHDRLIRLQKLIFRSDHRFSILYDRSFYFPMIDFSICFDNERRLISWH